MGFTTSEDINTDQNREIAVRYQLKRITLSAGFGPATSGIGAEHGGESPVFGPWAVSVDGNDNIWVSNFTSAEAGIVELCGFRTENCPPGMKTGDAISPSGGYVGGGLQMQVDVGIGPAGDVWVTNNWQDHTSCYGKPKEVFSTLCAGQGVVVFFGMAKPVRTPQIGPPRQP